MHCPERHSARRSRLVLFASGLLLLGCRATAPAPAPLDELSNPRRLAPAVDGCSGSQWVIEAERLEVEDELRARELLKRCLVRVGGPPSAYRLLASLEEDALQVQEARRTLLRAVAKHPTDAFSWAALARIEADAGRPTLALGAFERAYRLRPDHSGLARERARALERFGSEGVRRAARLATLLAEVDGLVELRDAQGALQVLEMARVVADGDAVLAAEVALKQAMLRLSQEDPAGARSAVERGLMVLEATPAPKTRADLLVVRAELELRAGMASSARLTSKEALAVMPRHVLALVNLGVASLALGEEADASEALRAALRSGISERVNQEVFLELPGVRALVARDPVLGAEVSAAWGDLPLSP